jgi:hypothetical protein
METPAVAPQAPAEDDPAADDAQEPPEKAVAAPTPATDAEVLLGLLKRRLVTRQAIRSCVAAADSARAEAAAAAAAAAAAEEAAAAAAA